MYLEGMSLFELLGFLSGQEVRFLRTDFLGCVIWVINKVDMKNENVKVFLDTEIS